MKCNTLSNILVPTRRQCAVTRSHSRVATTVQRYRSHIPPDIFPRLLFTEEQVRLDVIMVSLFVVTRDALLSTPRMETCHQGSRKYDDTSAMMCTIRRSEVGDTSSADP